MTYTLIDNGTPSTYIFSKLLSIGETKTSGVYLVETEDHKCFFRPDENSLYNLQLLLDLYTKLGMTHFSIIGNLYSTLDQVPFDPESYTVTGYDHY